MERSNCCDAIIIFTDICNFSLEHADIVEDDEKS